MELLGVKYVFSFWSFFFSIVELNYDEQSIRYEFYDLL